MRWNYLLPRIVILAMVWGFFVWAFDPLLRWSLIKTGEKINRAKVDVSDLKTGFFPPAIELTSVQIADHGKPGRNLVEFETFRLQVAAGPLAHRKLVIEEGAMRGLSWNTPRADSGQLEPGEDRNLGEDEAMETLRKRISALAKTWLEGALNSAKSQLDPQQLETVNVSKALKDQWLSRFQMYEARLKDLETRVKSLRDLKPEGNTLQKVEAYRQAAIEVQKLLEEVQRLRQELSLIAQTAGADLQQIDQARQRDLQSIQRKLEILKLDKDAISEALLGPELLEALAETTEWVKWTRENVGRLTAVREPVRHRGEVVPFPKPEDPYPEFLIRKLHLTGCARVKGEMVPYAGTLENIASDPKRWGKPVVLDIKTEGEAKIHLTATIDQTTAEPAYEILVEYRQAKPANFQWGDAEKLAFHLSAGETVWNAKLNLSGEQVAGEVAFQQKDVRIEPVSKVPAEVQVASIEPVRFEWDPQVELHRALAGVFSEVNELKAQVKLEGTLSEPKWVFSSDLGQRVARGTESYLATEMTRRKVELAGEVERLAGEEMARFRELLNGRLRETAGRLNLTEAQGKELTQKFASRNLDVRGLFR